LVLIAVPRADGKLKASGPALLLAVLQNSSSVSIDAGSHTKESLPSVFVSTFTPSVILLSIRRLPHGFANGAMAIGQQRFGVETSKQDARDPTT
jgi:hypothetical protein